jgi:hypothetical protein
MAAREIKGSTCQVFLHFSLSPFLFSLVPVNLTENERELYWKCWSLASHACCCNRYQRLVEQPPPPTSPCNFDRNPL